MPLTLVLTTWIILLTTLTAILKIHLNIAQQNKEFCKELLFFVYTKPHWPQQQNHPKSQLNNTNYVQNGRLTKLSVHNIEANVQSNPSLRGCHITHSHRSGRLGPATKHPLHLSYSDEWISVHDWNKKIKHFGNKTFFSSTTPFLFYCTLQCLFFQILSLFFKLIILFHSYL